MERNTLILVADDEPLVRAAHRYLLEGLGYGIVEAPDGERAAELALKHHFFAICLDIDMPKLSGIEATRKIRRSENPANRALIIGISSLSESKRQTGLAAGMDAVLNKPVPIEALKAILQHYNPIKMAC